MVWQTPAHKKHLLVFLTMCIISQKDTHMRTNIVIDDRLMSDALKATGMKTKRETVEEALRLLVRMRAQNDLLSLRGKIDWQGDLDEMRRD